MGCSIDFKKASHLLVEEFQKVEELFLNDTPFEVSEEVQEAADLLFSTETQSYREALLGCAVARLMNPEIDISLPYAKQGEKAFSGRSLDENVINPFLKTQHIPSSRGPYLATFRRNVRFDSSTAEGLKDREAYLQGFLVYLKALQKAQKEDARVLLRYLLFRFLKLREESRIEITRVEKLSLDQYRSLVQGLLSQPSGGMFPVLLVVALLETVKQVYGLNWEIDWQPINVADRPKGVGGDITVRKGGSIQTVFEVTERPIDRNRVQATFQEKISPQNIKDYLFVFTQEEPDPAAQKLAKGLFAQGHEIGFVRVQDWILYNLATAGIEGRRLFLQKCVALLEQQKAAIKKIWNRELEKVISPD